ncbi:MAG: tyrosine recombinase XerC [Clostridia bacterium]|nr:tyrosine recombinase XerC [Clostridia bacterium]
MFDDVPELVNEFLDYLSGIRNRSQNTIKEYRYDLRHSFRWLKSYIAKSDVNGFENLDIKDLNLEFFKTLTTENLTTYIAYLNREFKNKPATRARKVASLKSFFNYLANVRKKLDINPAVGFETPQLEKRIPKYLTLEESISLLHSVKFNEQMFGERDLCILTLFLNCGLRLSELINIDFKHIKDDRLSVIGKGNKERVVHLNNACLSSISKYVSVKIKENIKDREALFLSERGERIGRRMVEYIVKKYIELAGLDSKKFSPHKLRHTAATLMHKYGHVDIRALQQVLGHETIATTQIYTHIDSEQVKDAIDSNPLNNI